MIDRATARKKPALAPALAPALDEAGLLALGWAGRWPDFKPHELRCRGTGMLRLSPDFLDALQLLRHVVDRPMVLTSACRSAAHNRAEGGHPRSLHVCDEPQHPGQEGALAVDVATPDGAFRGRLVSWAWQCDWSIGWNARRGFLHLDRRDWVGLPQTTFDY